MRNKAGARDRDSVLPGRLSQLSREVLKKFEGSGQAADGSQPIDDHVSNLSEAACGSQAICQKALDVGCQ